MPTQPERELRPSLSMPPLAARRSPLRAFVRDDLLHAFLALLVVLLIGCIVLGRIVGRLAPVDVPAAGVPTPVAYVHPAFQDVPTTVGTDGKPLKVTLHADATRVDPGHRVTRYLFTVNPPNDAPYTLCDSNFATTCTLQFDGSRRERGVWIITLTVFDETGTPAETRTRLRVT